MFRELIDRAARILDRIKVQLNLVDTYKYNLDLVIHGKKIGLKTGFRSHNYNLSSKVTTYHIDSSNIKIRKHDFFEYDPPQIMSDKDLNPGFYSPPVIDENCKYIANFEITNMDIIADYSNLSLELNIWQKTMYNMEIEKIATEISSIDTLGDANRVNVPIDIKNVRSNHRMMNIPVDIKRDEYRIKDQYQRVDAEDLKSWTKEKKLSLINYVNNHSKLRSNSFSIIAYYKDLYTKDIRNISFRNKKLYIKRHYSRRNCFEKEDLIIIRDKMTDKVRFIRRAM